MTWYESTADHLAVNWLTLLYNATVLFLKAKVFILVHFYECLIFPFPWIGCSGYLELNIVTYVVPTHWIVAIMKIFSFIITK